MKIRTTSILSAAVAGIGFSSSAYAVATPYSDTPSAIVANGQELWDNQFAGTIASAAAANDKTGAQIIFVSDFCFSGGFLDDLSAQTNLVYGAAAANWDETSTGLPNNGDVYLFGQTFMQNSTNNDLGDSFAAARSAVGNAQTPVAYVNGGGASDTLMYNTGDRAIIFSSGDANNPTLMNDFSNDVNTTYNSLVSNSYQPWASTAITTLFDQGETTGPYGQSYIDGASTITNLTNAIDNVYTDPTFTSSNKLFIYLNDHGAESDVIYSKVSANNDGTYHYKFQVDVGNYKPTGTGAYGVQRFFISTGDANAADYLNFTDNLPGDWLMKIIGGNQIEVYAPDPTNSADWLVAGTDYTFSFDNPDGPSRQNWQTYLSSTYTLGDDSYYNLSDGGIQDGTAWGSGVSVYDVQTAGANGLFADPSQAPGWDNGGDGWVIAPAPEPSQMGLLLVGGSAVLFRRWRKKIELT